MSSFLQLSLNRGVKTCWRCSDTGHVSKEEDTVKVGKGYFPFSCIDLSGS